MDAREHIDAPEEVAELDELKRKTLREIPVEELCAVRPMNRKQRRAWFKAKQKVERRKARTARVVAARAKMKAQVA